MTDFKHIEEQIAVLDHIILHGPRLTVHAPDGTDLQIGIYELAKDLRDTMQAMLDVVRAAEYASAEAEYDWHHGRVSIDARQAIHKLDAALDKLKENHEKTTDHTVTADRLRF